MPLDDPDPVAADWPVLLEMVEERVKPTRAVHPTAPWWRFERLYPELYRAIADLERVLSNSQVGQHAAFAFLSPDMVYAHTLNVFRFATHAAFCILQSRPHEIWARFLGSSTKDDLRYTPSDCIETLPFPRAWKTRIELEATGATCHAFRADLMVKNGEGLTKTYNRFHDQRENGSEILTLRSLRGGVGYQKEAVPLPPAGCDPRRGARAPAGIECRARRRRGPRRAGSSQGRPERSPVIQPIASGESRRIHRGATAPSLENDPMSEHVTEQGLGTSVDQVL